ncbi:MAG: CDP-glycerol glycerophosphotransferase family protein [Fibrobacteria bacterium]|nr:CDP-glycerol glycerophosphotransferase family protein [Fibrobacteria bacterium]
MYDDNSAALHTYIAEHTSVPLIWIAGDPKLENKLRSKGFRVLRKNSLAARMAVLRAPVLIYSHGEDDLDSFLKYFRKTLGMRVFLGHCHKHLKTSQMTKPDLDRLSPWQRRKYIFNITRFDLALASSPLEKTHFEEAFADLSGKVLPFGGAAHMDRVLENMQRQPEKVIVWFPTYRNDPKGVEELKGTIQEVISDTRLIKYLEEQNFQLEVLCHINSDSSRPDAPSHRLIRFRPPGDVISILGRTSCFISDYSGLIIDWLAFGRPMIHFPFDEKEYLKTRKLCISLQDLQFGPMVYSVTDLVSVLVQNTWRNEKEYADKRKYWVQQIFPDLRPGYAKRCYHAILNMREKFHEKH